jgi:hypothetical protein
MLEARKLAAQYRHATGKPLGISSEIAAHDVVRLMELEPAEPQQGYDAIGKAGEWAGKRVQIKGRIVNPGNKSSQRIGQIKIDQPWDAIMLLLMNEHYEPREIYAADRETILGAVSNISAKRRNRGALSVAKFKHLGRLVWSDGPSDPENHQIPASN